MTLLFSLADSDAIPGTPPPWSCRACGAPLAASCPRLTGRCQIDGELVRHRLEAAGATLLAMRSPSAWPATVRSALPDVIRDEREAYGYNQAAYQAPVPGPEAISAMDRTFGWLQLIPQHRYVLRRLVAARALVHPVSGRYVLSWRKLGRLLGADHHAVSRWHGYGIDEIVQRLALRVGNLPSSVASSCDENRQV